MKKLDSKMLAYLARTYGKKFDEGGDVSGDSATDPSTAPAPSSEAPSGFDGSGDVMVSDGALAQAGLANDQAPTLSEPEAPQESTPHGASGDLDMPNSPAPQTPSADAATQVKDVYAQAGVPNLEAGLKEEKQANVAEAKALQDQGAAEVKALQTFNDTLAKLPTANDIAQQYKAKDQALFDAYQSKKLDPNRVYANMSTGQKVTSGIALILGGIGSGLTHQPNLAAQMIDKAIERDIDAQKNSQNQSLNLWKMNKEEYGNDLAANLATQNQMLTGVKAQLMQASSSAKGPLAQAQMLRANAQIDQKIAENHFKLSLMQPTSDSFGIDPAKKVPWLVPQAQQSKVFDEIEAAQNTVQNAPKILKSFDDAANQIHGVDFVPGIDNADQKSMHALLGPTFKDVEGTVRQAAMDNMFKNTTPQFGDDANTIQKKRAALIGYLESKSAAPNASGFGINLEQYPSTNVRGAIPANPRTGPEKPVVKTMNGVKYQQVTGGWKRVQ